MQLINGSRSMTVTADVLIFYYFVASKAAAVALATLQNFEASEPRGHC